MIIKIKKNYELIILIFLLLILISKIDFLKKTYLIISKNYNDRFIDNYSNLNQFSGFCTKESHGYIFYIKNKFNLNKPPQIINLDKKRRKIPVWIFKQNYNFQNINEIILVNYNNKDFNFKNYKVIDNYNNKCFYLKKND